MYIYRVNTFLVQFQRKLHCLRIKAPGQHGHAVQGAQWLNTQFF